MLTIKSAYFFYPLISLATSPCAYAGQGLLDAQDPKVKRPNATITNANLLISNFCFKDPNMFIYQANTKFI